MISLLKKLETLITPWLPYLFAGWMLLATYFTLVPVDLLSSAAKVGNPNLGHVVLFGGWTLLLGLLLITYYKRRNVSVVLIVLAGIFFGALIEVLQILMPFSRTGEMGDIGFNTIGAVLAGVVLFAYKKRLYSTDEERQDDDTAPTP